MPARNKKASIGPTTKPILAIRCRYQTGRSTLYIRLKSRLIGCRADSVPWVVYMGPSIVEGGTIFQTPDLLRFTLKPNRFNSVRTFFIAEDWCWRGMLVFSFGWTCILPDSYMLSRILAGCNSPTGIFRGLQHEQKSSAVAALVRKKGGYYRTVHYRHIR
jgi:hypothetical protein